jgi:hypothetical protein
VLQEFSLEHVLRESIVFFTLAVPFRALPAQTAWPLQDMDGLSGVKRAWGSDLRPEPATICCALDARRANPSAPIETSGLPWR